MTIFWGENSQNLDTYQTYKNLSETIKRKSKKNFYPEKILSFKDDAKKTWKTIKIPIWKSKMRKSSLSQKIRVKITEIFDQKKISTEFNWAFASFDATLANQIPENKNTFESYLYKISAVMPHKSVSINELKDVLKLTIALGLTN